MARGRGRGPQRPVKGFRPGKEPPQLRKRQAKQQFGEMNAAQERLVEMFAERTPEEARAMMSRWRTVLLVAGVVLAILGAVLWAWSWIAGLVVEVIAALVLFFWWQLHRQREGLEAMADAVSGGGGGGRGRRKR